MSSRVATMTVALAAVLAGLSGCNNSDSFVIPPSTMMVELRYDGDNNTAPNLPAATYEAAARFTAVQTAAASGGELVEVRFYIQNAPDSCQVKVYGAGTSDSPGALLYSADVTASIVANDWNSHVLSTPVAIPNGDLWIAVEFTHAASLRVIGCDLGPAAADGDWLFASTDGNWTRFGQRFPPNSVNWNVRGIAEVTR